MRGTTFGLRLKAVGSNARSAHLMGIPTERYTLGAFALCGALAGLAGAIQVTGAVPQARAGRLGRLRVPRDPRRAARGLSGARGSRPIALFFAVVAVGSTQLSLRLDLDSSLGGVLQGVLVLFVILAGGWQARRRAAPRAPATCARRRRRA